jgi:hypothetical protein
MNQLASGAIPVGDSKGFRIVAEMSHRGLHRQPRAAARSAQIGELPAADPTEMRSN